MAMSSAWDPEDPEFEDEKHGPSLDLAHHVAAKYQGVGTPPLISRSTVQRTSVSPASPTMTLAHPPNSQQPQGAASSMETQLPSQSMGAPSGSSDARAISDKVYEIMKRELMTSQSRR